MASLEQLGNALKQADAAGDTASAQILANAYRKEQARLSQAQASAAEPQVMAGKRGGMVEEGTISREDYMSQRGPVNEAYAPIPQPDRMYDTLKAEGIPFGNMRLFAGERRLPASGSIGMKVQKPDFGRNVLNKGVKPIDLGPQSVGVPEKSTFAQAGAMGIGSIGRGMGALGDTVLEYAPGSPGRTWVKGYRAANEGRGPVEQGYTNLLDAPARALNGESWDDIRSTNTPLTDDWEALMRQSLEDRPVTTRAGQGVGLLVGGEAKLTDIAMREVPKLPGRLAPKFAALFRGNTMLAKGGRYVGRLGGLAAISEAGYQGFNYAAEASNRAIETGEPVDRMGLMAEEIDNPAGWLGLPALSVGARAVRAPIAATKNTIEATLAASKAAPRPEVAAAGIGKLPEIQWRGGSFTPTDVQTRQALGMTADEVVSLRNQAIDELLKNGFEPDDAEIAVRLLSYNNMSEVPEALFEISPALQEIAVVAGRLHGKPAHKIFRQFFADRAEAMPEQLRTALRTAIRASGDDFEKFVAEMKQAGREAADPGYRAAHGTQITDETWDNILDLFGKQVYKSQTKSGKAVIKGEPITAARLGAELARTSARGRNDYFAAAAELESLALSLERGALPNERLSTVALDFLDRGIGRRVKTAVRKGDSDFASSLLDFRGSYRGSGLDADTGLNVPRTLYAQYKAVGRAAEFGEKAAGRTIPLRQMKQQFIAEMRNADEAFEAGIGEGSSIIDTALLQGWVRGAENAIDMAPNPKKVLTDLYGTPRQREKLLSMMRELDEGAGSGFKGDNTKRIKALVGSKPGRADYKPSFKLSSGKDPNLGNVEMPSLFDRQKNMLESERLVYGGSPTGGVNEAMANQLGKNKTVEGIYNMLEGIYHSPGRFIARQIDMRRIPLLRQDGASEEIGKLLTTSGRERLLSVIDEIRQRAIATGKLAGPDGAPPVPPRGGPPGAPPAGGSPAGPIRAGGFAGFGKKPLMTAEALASSDEKLSNMYAGLKRPADTPADREIMRLGEVENEILSELDQLNNRAIDLGLDPAIIEARRIQPSDVSPNAWPQMQELRDQMDDAALRLMRTRDQKATLLSTPEADAFGRGGTQQAPANALNNPAGPIRGAGFMGFGGGKKPPQGPSQAELAKDLPKIRNSSKVNETTQRRWDLAMRAARQELRVAPPLRTVGPDGVPKATEAEVEKLAIDIAATMGILDPAPFLKHADTAAQVIQMRPRPPRSSGLSGPRSSGAGLIEGLKSDAGRFASGFVLAQGVPMEDQGSLSANLQARAGLGATVGLTAAVSPRLAARFGTQAEADVAGAGLPGGRRPPQGHSGRVSTRVPFAKGEVEDHIGQKLQISTEQFLADPKLAQKAQDKIHTYTGFEVRQGETPEQTIVRFKQQVSDNLLFLYDNIAPEIRTRSAKWYNGARKVVDDWSAKHELEDTQVSAVIAALSPQNEWNNNVSIAKRVIETFKNEQKTTFSKEMEAVAPRVAPTSEQQPILDAIRGKTLAEAFEMGDTEAAMWVRMFDEAHGERGVVSLSPEGEFGDFVRTGKGEPAAKRWNSFSEVAKAISVLRQPTPAVISDALGSGHKVRSFYNNMLDPAAELGDVTIDTHAAAAAHLRPFSSKDEIAVEAMRGIGHAKSGSSGLYGIYADAYREAAAARGILPREMQSVTWEAVKTLFTPAFKAGTKRGKSDPIRDIWMSHERGDITANEARKQIFEAAGGLSSPNWAKPGSDAGRNGAVRNAGNQGDVAAAGGAAQAQPAAAGGVGRGGRGAAGGVGKPSGGVSKLPKGPIRSAGFTGDIDFKAAGRRLRKGASILDRKLAQPVTRGIQKLEQRLASVDDPRNYGPRLADLGIPDNLDPKIPLFDQIADPAAAARILADNAAIKGGTEGGQRAISYVAGKRNQRIADAISNGDRSASVRQRQAAGQAYAKALKDVQSFFGPDGDWKKYKTIAARRTEQARRLKVLREAGEKVGISKADQLSPQRPITQPDREDMIINATQRAEKPPGYSTRNQMFAAVKTRAGNLDSRGRPRGSIADRPLALDREATRVEPAGQQMPVLPTQRARTGRDASAAVDNKTAQMLLDPEMATAGAYAARAGGAGFAPRPNLGRAVAGLGVAGAVGGAASGYMAIADKLRQTAENVRAADEERNRPIEGDPNFKAPVTAKNPPANWIRMSGNDRVRIQMTLNKVNDFQMQINPSWGPQTMKGIEEFQKAKGLPVTGDLDDKTLKAINAAHYRDTLELEYELRQSQPTKGQQ